MAIAVVLLVVLVAGGGARWFWHRLLALHGAH
jgi:hypothetical protein